MSFNPFDYIPGGVETVVWTFAAMFVVQLLLYFGRDV